MPTTHLSRIRIAVLAMLALMAVMLIGAGGAAAYDAYWAKSGNAYTCQGYPGAVICKSKVGNRYGVMMDNHGIDVFTGSADHSNVQFACKWGCTDFRPAE